MPDGTNEGLHGFLVPIRDRKTMQPMPGVKVWDMGYKIGLNGIDNAALHFDNVRVPRDALLDATSQVTPEGKFTSSVEDSSARRRKRFLVLADQLLSGRVCIAAMTMGSTKITLDTAVKFSHNRKAVGPAGDSDTDIGKYQLQQRALMPLVANTYALNFAMNYIQRRYDEHSRSLYDETFDKAKAAEIDYEEIVRLCCIVKPLVTWHSENTATVCRERCGGQGFLAANRFGEAIIGAHAGITAEGDNRVIQQKVSKELLSELAKDKSKAKQAVAKHMAIEKGVPKSLRGFVRGVSGDVSSKEWQLGVFRAREEFCLHDLAMRLNDHKSGGKDIFESWMLNESDAVQALATAYGERIVLEQFYEQVENNGGSVDAATKHRLGKLCSLYAMDRIAADGNFLQEHGIVSAAKAGGARELTARLCRELGDEALDLTAAFGIPAHMHHAPIANNWEEYNAYENEGELEDQTYRKHQ